MEAKDKIRSLLNYVHLDITQNLKYDRLTKKIIKDNIQSDHNCIDIGCHKGEILEMILDQSPKGTHFAFEPLPDYYEKLKLNFSNSVTIYPFALSDHAGEAVFHYVKNAPAYSGIQKRKYKVQDPEIEKINVQLKNLDEVIPAEINVDFIKIDVEGGEFDVMKGAQRILSDCKPLLIFEFGKGASDYYGANPSDIFNFLQNLGYSVFTLQNFVKNKSPFNLYDFEKVYKDNKEYYFVASAD